MPSGSLHLAPLVPVAPLAPTAPPARVALVVSEPDHVQVTWERSAATGRLEPRKALFRRGHEGFELSLDGVEPEVRDVSAWSRRPITETERALFISALRRRHGALLDAQPAREEQVRTEGMERARTWSSIPEDDGAPTAVELAGWLEVERSRHALQAELRGLVELAGRLDAQR